MRVRAGKEEASGTGKKGPGLLKIREAIFGSADQIQIDAFEFIPTGLSALDKMMGGGIDSADSYLCRNILEYPPEGFL